MNRLTTRIGATAAGLAVCAGILTGCGSGQITQTSTQEAGVNGMSANFSNIALRNVHLQAVQAGDFLQPGRTVPLWFVAANNSPDTGDRLLRVTSDVGEVKLTGDTAIAANRALIVGGSMDQATAMGDTTPAASSQAGAEVTLTQPITNGLSYNFTFEFERAGKATIPVPISAGESPRG